MLVLFETSAGFALFKLLKDGRLDKPEVRAHAENEACRPGLFFFYGKEMAKPSRRQCLIRWLFVLSPVD